MYLHSALELQGGHEAESGMAHTGQCFVVGAIGFGMAMNAAFTWVHHRAAAPADLVCRLLPVRVRDPARYLRAQPLVGLRLRWSSYDGPIVYERMAAHGLHALVVSRPARASSPII